MAHAHPIMANGIEIPWKQLAQQAGEAGVFGSVAATESRLDCAAASSAQPATYRLELENGSLFVSLLMADRWQSHSIEADLLNTGDKVEELISEELVEIGYAERVRGDSLVMCEHYRTEEKLFCFRSKIPVNPSSPDASAIALQWLLAYEAAFRRLGDMDAGGGD